VLRGQHALGNITDRSSKSRVQLLYGLSAPLITPTSPLTLRDNLTRHPFHPSGPPHGGGELLCQSTPPAPTGHPEGALATEGSGRRKGPPAQILRLVPRLRMTAGTPQRVSEKPMSSPSPGGSLSGFIGIRTHGREIGDRAQVRGHRGASRSDRASERGHCASQRGHCARERGHCARERGHQAREPGDCAPCRVTAFASSVIELACAVIAFANAVAQLAS
jgi:hypothetical protein